MTTINGHGGEFVAEALCAGGVDRIYTLSGGHIFPINDGAKNRDIRIIDVRHEQTAGFAAEAHAKLTRDLGVAVVTAGPGVTNAISPITSAFFNGTPMMVLGGRAPQMRWGQGSLQEMDHLPVVRDVTKYGETVFDTAHISRAMMAAAQSATEPHRGPVFIDFPLDVIFNVVEAPAAQAPDRATSSAGLPDLDRTLEALASAERPVLLVGSDVWQNRAESHLRAMAEAQHIPVYMNGMGRGVLPADHELAFSATRGYAFGQADLVIVVGTRLDFRLGFGNFGAARVIHIADHSSELAAHLELFESLASADLPGLLEALTQTPRADRKGWVATLRAAETEKRAALDAELRTDSLPMHPARVYGEILPRLARDGIVICDGGDFVSYAGKFVDVYEPGGWLDPGPFGCLGTGPGYALAAGLLYPGRQVVLLLGDGAAGFGMGDWDSLVRFGVDVTIVCGNNGIWGLEKHPMQMLYGYDVAAELRPETRYDEVMRALGGHGELARTPDELGAALDRALATPGPSLVNVLTDPAIAYPRSANLA